MSTVQCEAPTVCGRHSWPRQFGEFNVILVINTTDVGEFGYDLEELAMD